MASIDRMSSKRARQADNSDDEPQRGKTRRVFACDTCRKIKTRCDFDAGSGICARCKNLRYVLQRYRMDTDVARDYNTPVTVGTYPQAFQIIKERPLITPSLWRV